MRSYSCRYGDLERTGASLTQVADNSGEDGSRGEMTEQGNMKTYTVRCEWDATGWWVLTVPELPGAISQVRHRNQVPGDVAEVVELMTGEQPGTYAIEIETFTPGPAESGAEARQAIGSRRQADESIRYRRQVPRGVTPKGKDGDG